MELNVILYYAKDMPHKITRMPDTRQGGDYLMNAKANSHTKAIYSH